MPILQSVPPQTQKKIVIEIIARTTRLQNRRLIKRGLDRFAPNEEKLNNTLRSMLKTRPIDREGFQMKMLILVEQLGEDAVKRADEILDLLMDYPTDQDQAIPLALIVMASASGDALDKNVRAALRNTRTCGDF